MGRVQGFAVRRPVPGHLQSDRRPAAETRARCGAGRVAGSGRRMVRSSRNRRSGRSGVHGARRRVTMSSHGGGRRRRRDDQGRGRGAGGARQRPAGRCRRSASCRWEPPTCWPANSGYPPMRPMPPRVLADGVTATHSPRESADGRCFLIMAGVGFDASVVARIRPAMKRIGWARAPMSLESLSGAVAAPDRRIADTSVTRQRGGDRGGGRGVLANGHYLRRTVCPGAESASLTPRRICRPVLFLRSGPAGRSSAISSRSRLGLPGPLARCWLTGSPRPRSDMLPRPARTTGSCRRPRFRSRVRGARRSMETAISSRRLPITARDSTSRHLETWSCRMGRTLGRQTAREA